MKQSQGTRYIVEFSRPETNGNNKFSLSLNLDISLDEQHREYKKLLGQKSLNKITFQLDNGLAFLENKQTKLKTETAIYNNIQQCIDGLLEQKDLLTTIKSINIDCGMENTQFLSPIFVFIRSLHSIEDLIIKSRFQILHDTFKILDDTIASSETLKRLQYGFQCPINISQEQKELISQKKQSVQQLTIFLYKNHTYFDRIADFIGMNLLNLHFLKDEATIDQTVATLIQKLPELQKLSLTFEAFSRSFPISQLKQLVNLKNLKSLSIDYHYEFKRDKLDILLFPSLEELNLSIGNPAAYLNSHQNPFMNLKALEISPNQWTTSNQSLNFGFVPNLKSLRLKYPNDSKNFNKTFIQDIKGMSEIAHQLEFLQIDILSVHLQSQSIPRQTIMSLTKVFSLTPTNIKIDFRFQKGQMKGYDRFLLSQSLRHLDDHQAQLQIGMQSFKDFMDVNTHNDSLDICSMGKPQEFLGLLALHSREFRKKKISIDLFNLLSGYNNEVKDIISLNIQNLFEGLESLIILINQKIQEFPINDHQKAHDLNLIFDTNNIKRIEFLEYLSQNFFKEIVFGWKKLSYISIVRQDRMELDSAGQIVGLDQLIDDSSKLEKPKFIIHLYFKSSFLQDNSYQLIEQFLKIENNFLNISWQTPNITTNQCDSIISAILNSNFRFYFSIQSIWNSPMQKQINFINRYSTEIQVAFYKIQAFRSFVASYISINPSLVQVDLLFD